MKTRTTKLAVRLRSRRAASLVEGAFVLNVLLVILLCMLDLGLAGMHVNSLTEAATTIARKATVHGEHAPPTQAAWGPEAIDGHAADGSDFANLIAAVCTPTDLQNVAIHVEWPDGDHAVDDRVRVELRYPYQPILPLVIGAGPYELVAKSVMRIKH